MKIKQALETIRIEAAINGKITQEAMRAYVEHRISKDSFLEASQIGLKQYNKLNGDKK